MVHITHNKHRLLELTIHIICWGLFFGFPLFFTQDDSGSIDWREFINHSGVSLSFSSSSMSITCYLSLRFFSKSIPDSIFY